MSRVAGRLEGKVALITGAARGQGEAEALLFAAAGASVVVTDVLDEPGEQVVERIRAAGGIATYIHLDVASADSWSAVVASTEERFGSLDILVGNAGVTLGRSVLLETSDEEWETTIAINQRGIFLGMRHCIPAMIRAGGGSIVNISSIYGLVGAETHTAYQASKFAVVGLTRNAARQYGPVGIRVNVVCPGLVVTPMSMQNAGDAIQALIARVPLRRGADPEEIANVVLFLASEEASYISGAEITVDGGLIA